MPRSYVKSSIQPIHITPLEGECFTDSQTKTNADEGHRAETNKLHPENFANMSGTMAGVMSYLLDVSFVKPTITRIAVTSDGCLLADTDEPGFGCVLGHYRDLVRNWHSLLWAAGLNPDEWMLAECLFSSKIGYFDKTSRIGGSHGQEMSGSLCTGEHEILAGHGYSFSCSILLRLGCGFCRTWPESAEGSA